MPLSGIHGYLRFPHINDTTITFVAEDDLWTAELDGSAPTRVLSIDTPIKNPMIAPDGKTIVFGGIQGRAPEIMKLDSQTGSTTRLTFWGDTKTAMRGFTPAGDAIAISSWAEPNAREPGAWTVPLDGSMASPRSLGPLESIAERDDLMVLATALSREPAWWKRYRGGSGGRLWRGTSDDGEFTPLVPDLDGNLADPMLIGDRIAFLSDHEGYGNIYSVDSAGADLRRHTDFEGFYARHASSDGSRIVFERAGDLYVLDSLDDEARPLDIRLPTGGSERRRKRPSVASHLQGIRPDRTARASAVEVFGTVHWLTHHKGPASVIEAEDGVRSRLVRPVGDSAVIWVSDAGGEETIRLARRDDSLAPVEMAVPDGPVRYCAIEVAPTGDAVAITTEQGASYVVDVSATDLTVGTMRKLTQSVGPVEDVAFNPDGRWLAFVDPVDLDGHARLTLAEVATAELIPVTDGAFVEHAPVFTADGQYLAFLSDRSLDPLYDAQRFDLSFPISTKPYLIPLAADTPSPFGPTGAGREPEKTSDDGASDERTSRVDPIGLGQRMVAAPVDQGVLRDLAAADGALLWIASEPAGVTGDGRATPSAPETAGAIKRLDLESGKCITLVDKADSMAVASNGKHMVVVADGTVKVLPTAAKPDEDVEPVDLDRIRMDLDPRSAWAQAFDEDWRLLRDFFWIEDMGGVDWPGVHAAYRPLVDRLGSHDDFVDLLWEIHGELGTSHAYVMAAGAESSREGPQGLLGADFAPVDDGWKITKILDTETSDPRARSPLRDAGVDVHEGDVVQRIDGRDVDARGPNALLTGAADKPVQLDIRRGDSDETRRCVAVPLADESSLRYQQWVGNKRTHVAERSSDRFGYLHVPDMIAHGWAQLHRGLHEQMAKDGVVIDVRGNSGGHTSELVADLIGHRLNAWTTIRHGRAQPYPSDSPQGPVVVVTDEFAGSDGDIITAICKIRGIGPVIGKRTWGGVIGIDGRFGLADGTVVTQPRFAFWFTAGIGWGVENHGVDPDIDVEYPPHDKRAGRDPQLDRAIEELTVLAETDPGVPPPDTASRPDRAPGSLPPRPGRSQ